MPRSLSRIHFVFLGLITAVAAFLRFYRLDQLPPGFQFDQAYYAFDVLRLLQGQFSIFFPTPGGTEPLFIYLAMVGTATIGVAPLGLKITTAVLGTLTVPCIFGLARAVFRSTLVGLLSALFAAISVWHIFFSRYGERVVLLVFLSVLAFWFFWRALTSLRWRDFVLTGICLGLGLNTYPAARVLPVTLILITLYCAWEERTKARPLLKGLGVILGVALLLFLPLAFYFYGHPEEFFSHSADVSIFVPHGAVQSGVPAALADNAAQLLKMFFVEGDPGMIRNIPRRPVFDPLSAVLFIVGVGTCGLAVLRPQGGLDRRRGIFLGVWILVAMGVSLFTDDAPNFVRTLPAMPAVMILPAWGAAAVWQRLNTPLLKRVGAAALAFILVAGAWSAFNDYFVTFGADPGLYYAFNADKQEVSDWLNQKVKTSHVYLAPVWYQVSTISLLTRNSPLKSFESRDTIVLPSRASGKDAVYVFPYDQERKVQTMQTRLGTLGTIEHVIGSNGLRLFLYYRIPVEDLPDPQVPLNTLEQGSAFVHPRDMKSAVWSDKIKLLGSSVEPSGPGGRNLMVTLFLRPVAPMGDYTFSIKVRDEKGRVWGQEDKWPGDNSYATSQWDPGDVIVERFYPGLDPCAPSGHYSVSAESYNPRTMQVLPLSDRDGTMINLEGFDAGSSRGNRLEDLQPEKHSDIMVGSQMQLIGLTAPSETKPGGDFSLALYWRGTGSGLSKDSQLSLVDTAGRVFVLGAQKVSLPEEGRGVCTLFDLTAPSDAALGTGSLVVNGTNIGTLNITR